MRRGMGRWIGGAATAVCLALATGPTAGAAPHQVPPTRPATTLSTPTNTVPPTDRARELAPAAAVDLAREAADLLALGAFSGATTRLDTVVAGLDLADADPATGLESADEAGAQVFAQLSQEPYTMSRDVTVNLAPLSAAQLAAAASGGSIGVDSESYLRALDHLLENAGAPPTGGGAPDPAAVRQLLIVVIDQQATSTTSPATTPGSSEPGTTAATAPPATSLSTQSAASSDDASGNSSTGWIVLVAVFALVCGAGLATFLLTRRRRGDREQTAMDDLLEVSRRLTSAAATGDVDRAIVREAVGLVPAGGGALVHRTDGGLRVAAESHPPVLRGDRLSDGIVGQVAETGQALTRSPASDPALTTTTTSVAAVPLVGNGRVEAVLVLVRPSEQPFTAAESGILRSLAPVAATALHSGRQARAAIEDSRIDGLTGVGNRRRFDEELPTALAGASPTSLIIIDLDHFKLVNDTHGHPAGDAVLRATAEVVRTSIRPEDSLYRFGGEEFCVVLHDTDIGVAVEAADRIRHAVESHAFDVGGPEPLRATASLGVARSTDHDAAALLARADAALYEAKEQGRNQVRFRN